jgi:zeaxanthin glucosyltransferase
VSHIGLLTPAYTGHVSPMITLGRELRRRGHQVSLISTPDAEDAALSGELGFIAVGAREFPAGSLERFTDRIGKLTGMPAMRFIIRELARHVDMHARDLPGAVAGHAVTDLVVDQIQPMGAAVADRFDLPFVSLCSLLPLNLDRGVPPWTMYWSYRDSAAARIRNTIGIKAQVRTEQPLIETVNHHRRLWGLKPTQADEFSHLAQIAQVPASFDFPRTQAPAYLHHTGPIHDYEHSDPVPFPWERLDGRALVYASMGTLQNRSEHVFRTIAAACADLDVQLVITLGHKGTKIPTNFPGNPVVVDYAPQLELIRRASLYIGPGGMNTLMQSLAHSVPMVLIPVTYDNPGVAARAKYHGVGEFVPVHKLTVRRLRTAIHMVLSNPLYRDKAAKFAETIKGADAVTRAADIVEEAFRTRRPVLRA